MNSNILVNYGAIIVIIVSTILYHIAQKYTPTEINPVIVLIVTYLAALILSIMAYPILGSSESLISEIKKVNWASIALGLAVVGIELGFLLSYRSGWSISKANITASAIIAVLLIPIGVYHFNESLSFINVIGVLICVLGVTLVSI